MIWKNRKKKWKINHEYRRVLTLDKIMGEILQEWKEKDKVSVVRCKECKHRHGYECPMYREEWFNIDEGDGWYDSDFRIIDETQDDGFCYCGEREKRIDNDE